MPASMPASSRSTKIRASIALLSVLGFGTVASLAAFSDEGSQLTTFSAGNLDLKFDGTTLDNPTALTTLNMDKVKPGTTKIVPLTVRNNGDLGFGYTMTTTATDLLAPALKLSVVKVASASGCSTATDFAPATSTDVFVASGTALNAVSTTSSRTLAPGVSDTFCFKVELPRATDNTFQGKNATATFAFRAEQS